MWNKIGGLFQKTWLNVILIFSFAGFFFWQMMKDNYDQIMIMFRHARLFSAACIIILMIVEKSLFGFFNNVTQPSYERQFFRMLMVNKQGIPVSSLAGILWLDFINVETLKCLVNEHIKQSDDVSGQEYAEVER